MKNPTKENLSGRWLGPCGFEIRVFPCVLSAYFGADFLGEEQMCFFLTSATKTKPNPGERSDTKYSPREQKLWLIEWKKY